jgi:hypothetical protein
MSIVILVIIRFVHAHEKFKMQLLYNIASITHNVAYLKVMQLCT